MNVKDQKQRFEAAIKLLSDETTTFDKLESAFTVVRGVNPKIDKALEKTTKTLSTLKNLSEGNIVSLSLEAFPEKTKDDKKRKKALVAFIKNINELKSEVERVKAEIQNAKTQPGSQQAASIGKIMTYAKGPFGITTIAALIIVAGLVVYNNLAKNNQKSNAQTPATTQENGTKIKVIVVDDKKIPLSEVKEGIGPECTTGSRQVAHYHAINGQFATALDGTRVADPGGCGLGKVEEIKIEEIYL